jgi:hypothetical protein
MLIFLKFLSSFQTSSPPWPQDVNIPASKLYQSTTVWNALGNFAAPSLENFNLGIGKVVFLQICDLLKKFETTFCVMVSS